MDLKSGRLIQVYDRFPSQVQSGLVTSIGAAVHLQRYSRPFTKLLEDYLKNDTFDRPTMERLQRRLLLRALHRASKTRFYGRLFHDLGVQWWTLADPELFQQIPITLKRHIQEDPTAFVPEGSPRPTTRTRSSGSTGSSVQIPMTRTAAVHQHAIWWRHRTWHGIRRGEWCAVFAGARVQSGVDRSSDAWRVNWAGRELRMSAYHLSDTHLSRYMEIINARNMRWIHGYPSAIARLAEAILRRNLPVNPNIKWITTGSENVSATHRALIASAFGRTPIDVYGLAEGVASLSECESGALHMDEDFAHVEVDGGSGSILGTNFHNAAYQLLRYDTGDLGILGNYCGCGRVTRVMESLDGRADDAVELRDGSLVGRVSPAFSAVPGLAEAQLVQDVTGEATVLYVPGPGFSTGTLTNLRDELNLLLGRDFRLIFQRVGAVERTAAGKVRLVRRHLSQDTIAGKLT